MAEQRVPNLEEMDEQEAHRFLTQTSPLNVRRIGRVAMAENCPPTRLSIPQEPHRNRVDEGLALRFSCHAHYTHVSQSL
jgi:hypothetical protein